jgi:hypothetical protein
MAFCRPRHHLADIEFAPRRRSKDGPSRSKTAIRLLAFSLDFAALQSSVVPDTQLDTADETNLKNLILRDKMKHSKPRLTDHPQ